MKLWLVIPVKPFQASKSRLHPVLNATQRAELSRSLLTGVLTTVMEFAAEPSVDMAGVIVISRDRAVHRLAEEIGASVMSEQGVSLNNALDEARREVEKFDADALLVLPSDLPLLAVEDLQTLFYTSAANQPGLTIAPSRDGGTNALLMRPPGLIDFAFGPNSFQRHCQLAHAHGHPCHVVKSPNLAFDLDWPKIWLSWLCLRNKSNVTQVRLFCFIEINGGLGSAANILSGAERLTIKKSIDPSPEAGVSRRSLSTKRV